MKIRIVLSVFILISLFTTSTIYEHVKGPIESEIAINQLSDSKTSYALSRAVARDNLILKCARFILVGMLLLIWINLIYKRRLTK